jgi:hypothetical protein
MKEVLPGLKERGFFLDVRQNLSLLLCIVLI